MSSRREPRPSIRPPQQARSQATLDRILEATQSLLEERFFDDLTVDQIARQAGVSIGSFYARFPGKEALLAALDELYVADLDRFVSLPEFDSSRGGALSDRVGAIVTATVRRYRRRRGLLRGVLTHVRLHPEWANEVDHAGVAALNRRLDRFILEGARSEVAHPDPERAVRLGMFFVSAACRERILFGDAPYARATQASDTELERELTRLYLSYLRGNP